MGTTFPQTLFRTSRALQGALPWVKEKAAVPVPGESLPQVGPGMSLPQVGPGMLDSIICSSNHPTRQMLLSVTLFHQPQAGKASSLFPQKAQASLYWALCSTLVLKCRARERSNRSQSLGPSLCGRDSGDGMKRLGERGSYMITLEQGLTTKDHVSSVLQWSRN